ncbi:hypothetical protein AB6R54_004572 [Vibrio parahaemolyticus]|uniref:hypothetical protein n=1 Tax=Vibrio cholerae TaxID=666 RepID=UPI0008418D4B|nr:hypothetical protein [Vibrio cholerae]TQQ30037.1 hypothetical protein FLL70_18520 [Vibrio cholerae]
MLELLSHKLFWKIIVGIAGFSGLYGIYLVTFGPAAGQAALDKAAIDDFGSCLTAEHSISGMKYCDEFYLEYLPKKTDPKYKRKIIEVQNLSSEQIIATYKDVVSWREKYSLKKYDSLSNLSNGQLEAKQN